MLNELKMSLLSNKESVRRVPRQLDGCAVAVLTNLLATIWVTAVISNLPLAWCFPICRDGRELNALVCWIIVAMMPGHHILRHEDRISVQLVAGMALRDLEIALFARVVIPPVDCPSVAVELHVRRERVAWRDGDSWRCYRSRRNA